MPAKKTARPRRAELKLAEALVLRADCQKRIEQLKQRLGRVAKVQEGDKPAEDPEALLSELEDASQELLGLIQRINRTNSATRLGGRTISDAIAERDVLRIRATTYRELAAAAAITQGRTTKSEVKFRSSVNISSIQKIADRLSKEHRDLDAAIQEANWQTELSK
jgi:hypothetical protein